MNYIREITMELRKTSWEFNSKVTEEKFLNVTIGHSMDSKNPICW